MAAVAWVAALATAGAAIYETLPPARTNIRFRHTNGMTERRRLPESIAPGVAILDFNGDGRMDLFFVNSAGPHALYRNDGNLRFTDVTREAHVEGRDFGLGVATCDYNNDGAPDLFVTAYGRNTLYRNNRDGTFTDVTGKAGVPGGTFGMGVAAADYDNDGWPDIFVSAYGNCILYHNNRDGTFTDVTRKAGLETPGWTTSAVWFDYDNDGKLDLFVCSFVDYGGAAHRACGNNQLGRHYYCIPRFFKPTASFLYRNNGDGTFTDVSRQTGIGGVPGKGLGAVAADINNDGRMDLFVANDTVQNFLFVNRGGKFEEAALPAEVAFSEAGQPRSGMGVDAADVFASGYQDLFVANVDQEMFSLYRNQKNETFRDVAHANGVAQATRLLSGWGLKFFDYDNDGAVDLILANGHPDDMIESYSPTVKYREPLLLFHQENGKLRDVSQEAGAAFSKSYPARGLAVGDFNNDGHLDVLIGSNGGAPVLLKNRSGGENHWLGLKLEGVKCNRDAIGARIRWAAGGVIRSRSKNSGGSYLSSHDSREVLGVGKAAKIEWVEITWPKPSGRVQKIVNPPLDRYITIREQDRQQLC
jgi:hypothetical protein